MQKTTRNKFLFLVFAAVFVTACNQDYTPKPRGFQRFEFTKTNYQTHHNACGFSFEIPDYATVLPDFSMAQNKCWYNVYYQPYNATLHLSFDQVKSPQDLQRLAEDARTLVYKHTIKADEIFETYIENENLHGMVYELSGNTATNFQFYVTDSIHNYMRGALYFNIQTNPDSVAPVLTHLKADVMHMIKTIRWTK